MEIVINFLNSIGIKCHIVENVKNSFLKAILIKDGELYLTKKCNISDILHEAGHLAILPPLYRKQANGDLKVLLKKMYKEIDTTLPENEKYMYCEDNEATAWAFSCGTYLKLPHSQIILKKQYQNTGKDVLFGLRHNSHFGIHGLARAGWCSVKKIHTTVDKPLYPNLNKWLQI